MSGKSAWGSESSKETVQCCYCSYKCRKDNLKQHVLKMHPGKPYNWKRVMPKNQPAIHSALKVFEKEVDLSNPDRPNAEQTGTKRSNSEDINIPGKAQRLIVDPTECIDSDKDDEELNKLGLNCAKLS